MTAKSEFDATEWELISEGPVTAGMIVLTASGGGSFRETLALSRAYTDARREHGESELLDEIVSAKPKFDRHKFRSPQSLRDDGLKLLTDAVGLVERKATPQELADYREFVVNRATKVAAAHKEDGQEISPAEQAALDQIRQHLGS
ncbi:MAG: hypothetical protein ACTHNU_04535 [Gaiellales bacterium]